MVDVYYDVRCFVSREGAMRKSWWKISNAIVRAIPLQCEWFSPVLSCVVGLHLDMNPMLNKCFEFLHSGCIALERSLREEAWTFDLCIFKMGLLEPFLQDLQPYLPPLHPVTLYYGLQKAQIS